VITNQNKKLEKKGKVLMSREKSVTVPDMSTEEFLRYASEQIGRPMEVLLEHMRPHMRDFMKDARGKCFEVAIEELEDGGEMEEEEERFGSSFKGNIAAFITWALRERPFGFCCTVLSKDDRLCHQGYKPGVDVWDGTLDFYRGEKTEDYPECMDFGVMSDHSFSRMTLTVVAFREIKS
jgi:hypothetical protein